MPRCTVCRAQFAGAPLHVQRVAEFDAEIAMYACPQCTTTFSILPDDFPLARWYAESEYYGEIEYAEHHDDPDSDFRFSLFLKAAQKRALRGHLLDVGCGEGDFLHRAKREGWQGELEGLDLHQERVQRVEDGVRITHGRLEDFIDGKPRFDVVTIFDTLEHFPEPADTLEALRGIMREDAWLALTVPNSERIRLRGDWEIFDYPPNHVTRWNAANISAFLERSGFSVVDCRASFPWPRDYGEQIFYLLYTPLVRFARLFLHRDKAAAGGAGGGVWKGPLAERGTRIKIEVRLLRIWNFITFLFLLPVSLLLRLVRPRAGTHLFVLARRKKL